MALKLIIGNKNYSSWSLRPWIAMKVAGIAFDEEVISLDAKDFKSRVTKISGTGKVPALTDGKVQVWESLAILEYLAEKYPDARLWPASGCFRSEEHTSELQSLRHIVCRLLLEKKKKQNAATDSRLLICTCATSMSARTRGC